MNPKTSSRAITFLMLIAIIYLCSCATILGGKVSQCQRTKPMSGQPARKIRTGAAIADLVFFWPGLAIDFATNAIYKPCK